MEVVIHLEEGRYSRINIDFTEKSFTNNDLSTKRGKSIVFVPMN